MNMHRKHSDHSISHEIVAEFVSYPFFPCLTVPSSGSQHF